MTGVFETQTLRVCPTEPIICVKEDCFAIPKFQQVGTFLNANIKSNSPQGFSRLFPCPSLWTPHSPQTKADFSIGGRTLSVAEHPNKTVDTFNSPVMDCRVATSERIKGQVGTKDSSELTLIHLFFIPVPIPVLLLPISNF